MATAVTWPFSSTVATLLSSELQVTPFSVAFSGATVAVSSPFSPTTNDSVAGATLTPVTGTFSEVMVMVHEASLPSHDAVITTVPALSALTRPEASTVAMLLSDDVQVTVFPAAPSGDIVTVIFTVPPSTTSAAVTSNSTLSTASPLATTVTGQEANLPPADTVIDAVPSASATTFPSVETSATALLDELHVRVLSVASAGDTVATSVSTSPTSISRDCLSKETEATAISLGFTVTVQDVETPHAVAVMTAVPSFKAVM